jgi:hypothetical protein
VGEGPFVIRTDHYSLKFLLDHKLSTIPQHQWANKLLSFDFCIEYRPGSSNTVANALSRRDGEEEASIATFMTLSFHLFDALCHEFTDIPELQLMKQEVAAGTKGNVWQVVDDLVTMCGKVFISPGSPAL